MPSFSQTTLTNVRERFEDVVNYWKTSMSVTSHGKDMRVGLRAKLSKK